MFVYVLSAEGFVKHGPARKSETQAKSVAALLTRRLGWVTATGLDTPPVPAGATSALPVALASLSPVWKDAELARQWTANVRRRVVAPVAPVPTPSETDTNYELAQV